MHVPLEKIQSYQQCITPSCRATYDVWEAVTECQKCGNLLDVKDNLEPGMFDGYKQELEARRGSQHIFDRSGVHRYRELFPFWHAAGKPMEEVLVSLDGREGHTYPVHATRVAEYVGIRPENFYIQFEGDNPTGSFKDNGMATGFTHAKMLGKKLVICASTGNTAAAMAAYAANEGDMQAVVLLGEGRVAPGKLSQALAHGAKVLQIRGGKFDDAMELVRRLPDVYLMNSINAYRLQGQETIVYRMLENLGWQVPDYIVLPGGNLGNATAFGNAIDKLHFLGFIDRKPRVVVVTAEGAKNALYILHNGLFDGKQLIWDGGNIDYGLIRRYHEYLDSAHVQLQTDATAIEIAKAVNTPKAERTIDSTGGMVISVTDEEMSDAAAVTARNGLFECDLASAASIAGAKKLVEQKKIPRDARVVAVETGKNKDPENTIDYHSKNRRFSNQPEVIPNDPEYVERAIRELVAD